MIPRKLSSLPRQCCSVLRRFALGCVVDVQSVIPRKQRTQFLSRLINYVDEPTTSWRIRLQTSVLSIIFSQVVNVQG